MTNESRLLFAAKALCEKMRALDDPLEYTGELVALENAIAASSSAEPVIDADWLRKKTASEPNCDFEAATPAAGGHYTEGICGDGAAILCDGQPITIAEVLRRLNAATPTTQPEAVHASGQSQVDGMLKIVDQWQMGKKKTFAAMDEISYLVAGWGQTPPTPEAERLAVEIADRYAKHDVREYSHCNGWYRPHPNDSDWWNKRIIYLDLRGLLEHHPDHPELVRVKEQS